MKRRAIYRKTYDYGAFHWKVTCRGAVVGVFLLRGDAAIVRNMLNRSRRACRKWAGRFR